MFILDNVEKRYGNVSVLKNISCKIPIDGFVVVMGPSGSGKSTLLRLLSFVETPDHGNVRLNLNGREFDSINSARPWPRLTCVFQKQFLWPHLTLRENISLPLHTAGVRELDSKLKSVIDLFGMSAFVDRFPNEVSGGQAQRAALARALVLDPQLILIDEAHGGLDLEQQKILNDYLIKLRESGVALIIVTHSLEFARRYADQVVIVEDGTVTDVGTRDILERPKSPYLRRAIGLSAPRGQ